MIIFLGSVLANLGAKRQKIQDFVMVLLGGKTKVGIARLSEFLQKSW